MRFASYIIDSNAAIGQQVVNKSLQFDL